MKGFWEKIQSKMTRTLELVYTSAICMVLVVPGLFLRSRSVQAMRWNQIIEMAVAALVLWVLVQNDNAAKDFGTQVITTMQNTLTSMLTVSY